MPIKYDCIVCGLYFCSFSQYWVMNLVCKILTSRRSFALPPTTSMIFASCRLCWCAVFLSLLPPTGDFIQTLNSSRINSVLSAIDFSSSSTSDDGSLSLPSATFFCKMLSGTTSAFFTTDTCVLSGATRIRFALVSRVARRCLFAISWTPQVLIQTLWYWKTTLYGAVTFMVVLSGSGRPRLNPFLFVLCFCNPVPYQLLYVTSLKRVLLPDV